VEETEENKTDVTVLGIFVADTTYISDRMPALGETLIGNSFNLGPGGKGSNQAVASAKSGAKTRLISKLGNDTFSKMALKIWKKSNVIPEIEISNTKSTGAACVFLDASSGDNAIIVCPGVAEDISPNFVKGKETIICNSKVLLTQLEQPIESAYTGLNIAKKNKVLTILNPAPAPTVALPKELYRLCDFITPNETEAELITGIKINSEIDALSAAKKFEELGVRNVIITLGEKGAYFHNSKCSQLLPAFRAKEVLETTGAGDAFNGGLAAALSRGETYLNSAIFGCATASISVTRYGTSESMPNLNEVRDLINNNKKPS
jgi:ribokinase